MSISKRKTKRGEDRFDVLYRGPDGRERSRTFRTRGEARRFEADQRVSIHRGLWVDPTDGRMTLEEWSEQWLTTTVHLSASTMRIYSDNIRLHVLPDVVAGDGTLLLVGLGSQQIGRLTSSQLTDWVAALTAKPNSRIGTADGARAERLSPASVHQAYRTLHRCLGAAVSAGRISRNPLDGVKPPLLPGREMRFLQAHEVERLADAIDHRYRALVLVGAYCGLRVGELMALRWKNVDLRNRTFRVVEQADAEAGPGAVKSPKTAAGRRSVPMPSFVADALIEHGNSAATPMAHGAGVMGAASWTGRVFTSPEGAPLHHPNFRQRMWVPAVDRAGVAPLRLHDLRHTCASLAIQAGADVKVLQRMLGHASAAITLDRYGHLMPGQAEAVADRLGLLREAAMGNFR